MKFKTIYIRKINLLKIPCDFVKKWNYHFFNLGLVWVLFFPTSFANAAPGQAATSLSSLCNILAPSSFTIPDRIKGEEIGFRQSILSHDKTTLPPMFRIDSFEKGDFSFITYSATLPTFPIIQPSSLEGSLGELANTSITAETRYVIGGGNSANEVCVYSYQIFQIAGQFIRTSLTAVDVKSAQAKKQE